MLRRVAASCRYALTAAIDVGSQARICRVLAIMFSPNSVEIREVRTGLCEHIARSIHNLPSHDELT